MFITVLAIVGFLVIGGAVFGLIFSGNPIKKGKAVEAAWKAGQDGTDAELAALRPQNPTQRRMWVKHYGTDTLGGAGLGERELDLAIARLRARDGV